MAQFLKFFLLVGLVFSMGACGGKYSIKSYPIGAKVYTRDIQTQEKKLVGISPVQLKEESRLGDVFFLVFEKQNFRTKEVMVKVNAGESIAVEARMDPLTEEEKAAEAAKNDENKDKPQPPKPEEKKPEEKKMEELMAEIADLKLRVALLENTASFYKDALFSPRLAGGMPTGDRDKNETVIAQVFQGQQAIMKGNFKGALEAIDKALRLDEYSTNAWLIKGSTHYLMKDWDAAKVAWERTLKLDPYNKVAYQYLSDVYKRLGLEPLPANGSEMRYPAANNEIERRNKKVQ